MSRFANIEIVSDDGLAFIAEILGEILDAPFSEDVTGKYDEFPAYIADVAGTRHAILASPSNEGAGEGQMHEYQLMLRPIPPALVRDSHDVTNEIVAKITDDGRLSCRPLE